MLRSFRHDELLSMRAPTLPPQTWLAEREKGTSLLPPCFSGGGGRQWANLSGIHDILWSFCMACQEPDGWMCGRRYRSVQHVGVAGRRKR